MYKCCLHLSPPRHTGKNRKELKIAIGRWFFFWRGGGGQGGPKMHVQVFMKIVGVQRNRCDGIRHFLCNWFMKIDQNHEKSWIAIAILAFHYVIYKYIHIYYLYIHWFVLLRYYLICFCIRFYGLIFHLSPSFHGATMSGGCLRLRSRLRQLAWKLVWFEEGVVGFLVGPLTEGTINCWYMGVSKNRGTPKSSILIGFSIINHPFWGIPIFGNTHILILKTFKNSNIWKAFRNTKNWNIPFIFCVFFNQRWSHD